MNLVSLCSGYGGLDLAGEAAFGASTVAYSEIEDAPSQVFARHWPDARPLGDLTAVDWTTVDADIVCAGFPCQDLSYAGKGRGIVADSRSGLWYAIEHALGVLRPRYVVLENVNAIVARRPGLDVVLAGLAGLGFDAEWTCVRASDVGAPHRRERWFLVAYASGVGCERSGGSRGRGAGSPNYRESAADPGRTRLQGRGPSTAGRNVAPGNDRQAWGDYAPAIARWERIVGRWAPAPTDDRGRLSPPFVEWMMGLPWGWVTDTEGLSRSQQLKCLGNGVVPQQAAYALSSLLDVREVGA